MVKFKYILDLGSINSGEFFNINLGLTKALGS